MFILLIVAIFGNLTQMQLKYDHCKSQDFKGEYCVIQKKLNDHAEKHK